MLLAVRMSGTVKELVLIPVTLVVFSLKNLIFTGVVNDHGVEKEGYGRKKS